MADGVGAHNAGVLADYFHVNNEDGTLTDTLRLALDSLMSIHLGDTHGQAPGTGHIDFMQVVRALNSMGFSGNLWLDAVPARPDWKTLVKSLIHFMKRMELTAALQDSIASAERGAGG